VNSSHERDGLIAQREGVLLALRDQGHQSLRKRQAALTQSDRCKRGVDLNELPGGIERRFHQLDLFGTK
jgi:hypothetical protein